MKAKNQQHFTSEVDAKDKLIVYVYEYLIHSGARQAADMFVEKIGYNKQIEVKDGPGFLLEWWCVFWDLYCAAPDRRHLQPESSSDARAFHDFMRSVPMSPSITQASPPQQTPQFMSGSRYGPPSGQPPPPPRMQGPPPPRHGGPPPGPPGGFMPSASPRYAQHSAGPPPPPQSHMSQGVPPMGFGPGPEHQMGPSPGLNRMTPVGGPPPTPQQMVGPPGPPSGPPPQMVGMPPGQQMGGPPGPVLGQGPSQLQMQGGPPPRNGSQGNAGGWQGGGPVNAYGNVNSPANQPMYSSGPGSNQPNQPGPMMMGDGSGMMEVKSSPLNGGEPSTPHSDEYVMPVSFGQDTTDQCDSAEILKLKQSMQDDTTKMFEKDQSEFSLADYSDSQGKWS